MSYKGKRSKTQKAMSAVVVSSPALGEALKEAERILESGSDDTKIQEVLAPVISASYPPPRTRPYVRVILPILLSALSDCKEEGDRRSIRKYVLGFLRREFPEIFPFTGRDGTVNATGNAYGNAHAKKNKDKYNKETRPDKWRGNKKPISS